MVHLEDVFPFLHARFNGLPAIVEGEPRRQVIRYRFLAIVQQIGFPAAEGSG